jgi:ABC-type sugar transport system permease subunit
MNLWSKSLPAAGEKSPQPTKKLNLFPYILIAPAIGVAMLVAIAPLLYGIWLSLQDWYLLRSPTPSWGGLRNYRELISDSGFWRSFGRTWFWTLGTVAVEYLLGLPIALLLNRKSRLSQGLSALILTPWVTPFIVAAYGWRYLLDSQVGLVHSLLQVAGLVGNRSILSDPNLSLSMVTFISGWKGVPFMVIALLAALKSIPDELYEAARIDGAGTWQQFVHITLPLIRNTAIVIGLVLGILAFYSFDLVWIMTQGGPSNSTRIIGIEIYRAFFTDLRPAYAATISTTMLVVLMLAAVITLKLRGKVAQ